MNKNYYHLRITKSKQTGADVIEAYNTASGEWICCHNDRIDQDEEDIRQYHSILPNFINPYLKANYNL